VSAIVTTITAVALLILDYLEKFTKDLSHGPRPTQPSIPPWSVKEYQLWLGRQRQVWFIPLADECRVCR